MCGCDARSPPEALRRPVVVHMQAAPDAMGSEVASPQPAVPRAPSRAPTGRRSATSVRVARLRFGKGGSTRTEIAEQAAAAARGEEFLTDHVLVGNTAYDVGTCDKCARQFLRGEKVCECETCSNV